MGWLGFLNRQESHQQGNSLDDVSCDLYSSQSERPRSADEKLADRFWPTFECAYHFQCEPPSDDICFLTVADYRFYRGLEALLLSLLETYPTLQSVVYIIHDGTLVPALQNRLLSIYANLHFWEPPAPAWEVFLPKNSANRKRIGALGYLNTLALSLRNFKRVVVLDSDLLIEGPLDRLWLDGDQFRLVPDCGVRAWTPISSTTGKPVLNSGVISIPAWALCSSEQERMGALIETAMLQVCPLLDRFADQKIWNLFLIDQPLELLPVNYNCNSKYLFRHLSGRAQGVSVIHFAGPKPWLTWPWLEPSQDYLDAHPSFTATCWLWNDRYCRLLLKWRSLMYRDALHKEPAIEGLPDAIVSNSFELLLSYCDQDVSLHLCIYDAEIFGGFASEAPYWPSQWKDASMEQVHLWMPYEFEPLIRDLPESASCRIHWLLIEAPFSPQLAPSNVAIPRDPASIYFDPWSPMPLDSVVNAVQQRLAVSGANSNLYLV